MEIFVSNFMLNAWNFDPASGRLDPWNTTYISG